jgi:hypothetical protein
MLVQSYRRCIAVVRTRRRGMMMVTPADIFLY